MIPRFPRLAMTFLALLLAPAISAWAQTMTVTPTAGQPGEMAEVRGSGFSVSDLSLHLSDGATVDEELAQVSVGRTGEFTQSITVPAVAAGLYDIVASDLTGTELASTPFSVNEPVGNGALILLPAVVAQGGEILASVTGQPASSDRELRLRFDDGSFLLLDTITVDRFGNALVQVALPDVAPGSYIVDLAATTVLASADLTVTAGPMVTLTPASGVGGQKVTVQISGLSPGAVTATLDGAPLIGPVSVSDGDLTRQVTIPVGGVASLALIVENRVGDRLIGSTQATFERLRALRTTVESMAVTPPAQPFQRGALRTLTGQLALPDGVQPENYQWTLVWRKPDGRMWPINVAPFAFSPAAAKGATDNLYDYAVKMTAPSVLVGFSFADLNRETDEVGVVYQVPKTEGGNTFADGAVIAAEGPAPVLGSGYVTILDPPLDMDDEQGVTINGRVVDASNPDPATNGVDDAIVAVEADTLLIYDSQVGQSAFDILGKSRAKAPGDTVEASRAVATLFEQNQLADALQDLSAPPPLASGCPQTLDLKTTNAQGEYSISFSPEVTRVLQGLHKVEYFVQSQGQNAGISASPDLPQDRFKVRISALHLDPGYGIPSSLALSSFTGVRYDFERENDGGYFICANFDENCSTGGISFNPFTTTLVTELQPAPSGITYELQSEIVILGLDSPSEQPGCLGLDCPLIWNGLLTFPNQDDNPSINQESLTMRVNWAPGLFGIPDGVSVEIDGLPGSFPLLLAPSADSCTPGKVVYEGQIPGLAVEQGPITGQVSLVIGDTLYLKNIQINTIDGPTWFEDGSRYHQPPTLSWSPQQAFISATELPKSVDASQNVNSLEIGQVDNNNAENATTITQQFMAGAAIVNPPTRNADLNVTVINEGGPVMSKALKLGPETAFAEEIVGLRPISDIPKGSVADLIDRPGDPTIGSKQADILFSAWTPLFRYAWGVPPIAAAVLGADLIYGAKLLYFGYITATDFAIDVDSVTEPSSFVILNVFFDFSAIFGLISASMQASPEIGVGLPLVITDSLFDSAASNPCFEFLLKLVFEVSVGPCPLCVGASYSATPVDVSKPDQCVIGANAKVAVAKPSADSIGLATNEVGTTFAIVSESDGVKVQQISAGVPDQLYTLDSGPGAMQPEVAFYRADAGVAVWSQSGLSESEFDARVAADYDCTEADVQADPNCADQQQFDASAFQHLVFAHWDGMAWSTTMDLTTPTTGDGGVKLAACMETNPACPVGGEVLAVWHRDMAGDLSQHHIKLFYAVFDGVSWSPETGIDMAVPGKDLQPAPLYVNGSPMIVWVRNDAPLDNDGGLVTGNRVLAYRFLDSGAGTQLIPNLPASVASPSAVSVADTIYLTFTSSDPNAPFVGNRRALYGAVGFQCTDSTGTCQFWLDQRQKDQHGRDIFVEKPRLVLGQQNTPAVFYRWLGTGGSFLPGDPIGIFGLGDSAVHVLTLPEAEVNETNVNFFTNDGLVNWQTAAIFDPAINSMISVSAQTSELALNASKLGFTARPLGGVLQRKLATSRPITQFQMNSVPDLKLASASSPSGRIVQGDDVATLRVEVANLGTPLDDTETVVVEAWWDGLPGVGTFLGGANLAELTDPTGTPVEFSVDIPTGVESDTLHVMYLVVNPGHTVAESDGENNGYALVFNQMPVPQNVDYLLDSGGTTSILAWDDPADDRVTGYRIYRRLDSETEVFQVGMSPRLGFVDMLSLPGETYHYCVSSLSTNLAESECSDWVMVAVKAIPGELVFADSFESSAP